MGEGAASSSGRDILHDFRRFVSQDNGFHGDGGTQLALLLGKHLKIQIIQTQLHRGSIALSHATQLHHLPEGNPAFQHTERCFVILAVIQQADGQNAIGFYGICGGACFGKGAPRPKSPLRGAGAFRFPLSESVPSERIGFSRCRR